MSGSAPLFFLNPQPLPLLSMLSKFVFDTAVFPDGVRSGTGADGSAVFSGTAAADGGAAVGAKVGEVPGVLSDIGAAVPLCGGALYEGAHEHIRHISSKTDAK